MHNSSLVAAELFTGMASFPKLSATVRGVYTLSINGKLVEEVSNLIVTEGRNYLLSSAMAGSTQITAWYIALFSGNVTPQATWTAATFPSIASEFTNYSEPSRRQWIPGSVSSGSIDNYASKATFTISANNQTIYGAAMLSGSAKSSTTGVLLGAALFTSPKTLDTGETIDIGYALSLT